MDTPTIETDRLILRKFSKKNLQSLFLILKDKEGNKFSSCFPVKILEETKKFYEERYAEKMLNYKIMLMLSV